MSRGLKWKPRLSAQHTGFLRQSSCLSWGEKARQNLHRNLQVICFSFSVLTESAHMPSQGCPRQLELCSKRPFICVFVPQPCHSSPPLRRACLSRGVSLRVTHSLFCLSILRGGCYALLSSQSSEDTFSGMLC